VWAQYIHIQKQSSMFAACAADESQDKARLWLSWRKHALLGFPTTPDDVLNT
jgi:hypothetical protein